jgi:hypothetical protein
METDLHAGTASEACFRKRTAPLEQIGPLRWKYENQQPVERNASFGVQESIPPWELTTSVEGEQKPGRWEEGVLATRRQRSGRCSSE